MEPYISRARERWNLTQLSDSILAVDSAGKALARNCIPHIVCVLLLRQLRAGSEKDIGKEHSFQH